MPVNVIPTMTSNTTPSGVVSYSSQYSSTYAGFQAFDHTIGTATGWATTAGDPPHWIAYQFDAEIVIGSYAITSVGNSNHGQYRAPKDWEFQGSSDGVMWDTLDTRSAETGWSSDGETRSYDCASRGSYAYYRLWVTAITGGEENLLEIDELEMFEAQTIFSASDGGDYSIYNSQSAEDAGAFSVGLDPFEGSDAGVFSVYNNQSASDAARFAIYNPQEAADGAKYSIFESFTAADHAKFKLFNGFAAADAGLFRMFIPVESGDQGFYRIANDALVRFGLFVGVDAAPNFDAAPATSKAAIWDSSNHRFVISGGSLSRSLAAPVSGTTDYHLVLRLQNAWGLWSENLAEQIITLNADGEVPAVKPSAGIEVKLTQSSFDTATLTARYLYLGDGDNAADYWQIYLTTNGSDPDVGTDEPAYVPMLKSDGAAKLSYDRSSLTPGTVVKVILRTLRGSDQTPSTASPIITLTILGTEPDDISRADVFQGSIAQQIQ